MSINSLLVKLGFLRFDMFLSLFRIYVHKLLDFVYVTLFMSFVKFVFMRLCVCDSVGAVS
jgi:hypothetical protein